MKLAIAILSLLLAACGGHSVQPDTNALASALSGHRVEHQKAADFSQLVAQNPFELDDEMQAFAEFYAPDWMSDAKKAVSLQRAIMSTGALGMDYDPYATFSAADAFALQTGNCLSFTMLYYAMARYVGINAYINEVDVPATWDLKGNNTYVFFRHVNVRVKLRSGTDLVVDLDMDNFNDQYRQRKISEKNLTVQYFNNIGMESLSEGQYGRAFMNLRQAIRVDDSKAYVWSNLGTLYRRLKLFPEAEAAYLQALQKDGSHRTSLSNLARLYQQTGETEKAAQYEAKVAHYRSNNPYNRYHLAEEAYSAGDYDFALKEIKKAIRGFPEDHRFHHLAGQIYLALEQTDKARQSYAKAAEYSKKEIRAVYERKLVKLDTE